MTDDTDWDYALLLAQRFYDTGARELGYRLADWVRAKAPKPSVREQLKALSAGTIFTLTFEDGDTYVYVKQWTGTVLCLTAPHDGVAYAVDTNEWDQFDLEVKWRPEDDSHEEGGQS